MKIWITGIAGFLGSHIADDMKSLGYEVSGNDNLICGSAENYPAYHHIDCCDFDALKDAMSAFKPDVVVHCAATASEGFSVFSPHFITKNIAEASVSTFSAAIASGAKRIVYMTSMARYGKGHPPFNECDPTNPIDPYGVAKVYAEEQLKTLCNFYGVKWSILVPHNIIGTRQQVTPYRNVVSIFLNRLKMNFPVYIYGDGWQKRCFSPVADCIHSIKQAIHGAADGEVVNIGPDGGEISINDVLGICEDATGIKANRVYLPPRPLTDEVREAYCSSDKARSLLGYEPQQSLHQCIREMAVSINAQDFDYNFPIEIESENIPKTWKDKL